MSNSTPPDGDPVPDLEEIIEIKNPSVDVTSVMAEIRATLRRHGPLKQPAMPPFGMAPVEGDGQLAFLFAQANLNYDQVWAEVNVIRPAVPLIGRLIGRAKGMLHEVAVYYVNMHAGKQINFNASIVRILNSLVQQQRDELLGLRTELEHLRARVSELEASR